MRSYLAKAAFIGVVAAVSLSGCPAPGPGAQQPDLLPFDSTGIGMYCETNDAGDLVLFVRNQGGADALSSALEVVFPNVQPGVSPAVRPMGQTGPLGAGETSTSTLTVEFPEGCFNPDCEFTITVDVDNAISESNEQNNTVDGWCIG